MTEYDYSPEARERYMATQNRIAKWVEKTEQCAPQFQSPFGQRVPTDAETTRPTSHPRPKSHHPSRASTLRPLPPSSSGRIVQPGRTQFQPTAPSPSRNSFAPSHSLHSPTSKPPTVISQYPGPSPTYASHHFKSPSQISFPQPGSNKSRSSYRYTNYVPSQGYSAPSPSYIIIPPKGKKVQVVVIQR